MLWGIEKERNNSGRWKLFEVATDSTDCKTLTFKSLLEAAQYAFDSKKEDESVMIYTPSYKELVPIYSMDELVELSLQYDGFA